MHEDAVVHGEGQAIPTVWDFKLALRQDSGRSVKVTLDRDGKQQEKDVKVSGLAIVGRPAAIDH